MGILDAPKSPGPSEKLSSPLLLEKTKAQPVQVQPNKEIIHPVQAQKFYENFGSSPVHIDWADGLVWTPKKSNPLLISTPVLGAPELHDMTERLFGIQCRRFAIQLTWSEPLAQV